MKTFLVYIDTIRDGSQFFEIEADHIAPREDVVWLMREDGTEAAFFPQSSIIGIVDKTADLHQREDSNG